MAFHFPLEAVLRLRRGQERVERLNLEAIVSEQRQTRGKLDEVTQSYFESRRRFQQQLGETLFGSEVQFEAAHEATVSSLRVALQGRLEELERRRLAQVQIYWDVRQKRKVLENLYQRKFDLYHLEQSRREQQNLDDLFLMRQGITRDE